MTDFLKTSLSRRAVLQTAAVGAVGINPALRAAVYAQGSDAPEKKEVRIGFIHALDVFNWCSLILNCCTTISAVPKIQSNWLKVFRQPWLLQGREIPDYKDLDALAREVHRS